MKKEKLEQLLIRQLRHYFKIVACFDGFEDDLFIAAELNDAALISFRICRNKDGTYWFSTVVHLGSYPEDLENHSFAEAETAAKLIKEIKEQYNHFKDIYKFLEIKEVK